MMEYQTEEMLERASANLEKAIDTMKQFADWRENASDALEIEITKSVQSKLSPGSFATSRWFYEPLPNGKVKSLFNIDIVDGEKDGHDVLVIVSAKSVVNEKRVEELAKQIDVITAYLDILRKGGYGQGNGDRRLKDQDQFFSRFVDYRLQGSIGGPLWNGRGIDAAKEAGYWRIVPSGFGYDVETDYTVPLRNGTHTR